MEKRQTVENVDQSWMIQSHRENHEKMMETAALSAFHHEKLRFKMTLI